MRIEGTTVRRDRGTDWERSQNRAGLIAIAVLALVAAVLVTVPLEPTAAAAPAGAVVIDDFDDGDVSDWIFFGGNGASGGGGGAAADRPIDGSHYFSTGWGGAGSADGFYGGAFRNVDEAMQVGLPSDPWFNVWVYNQSDATVDAYNLEITLREDTDGDGWTNGSEDSFQLVTPFSSADFDDTWTRVSAPISSFANLGTGGNGTFDGDLDEVVIVIGGVAGAAGSTVEVDFDLLAFSSGGPLDLGGGGGPVTVDEVVFDDMEHGNPFGSGWFSFGGSVGGGGIDANPSDLPPTLGGVFSLQTGWGSGGVPGFFGGFGRTNPVDVTGPDHFNFLINPDAGQDYTLEVNLQDDDDGDGAIPFPPDGADDEFQFDCVVSPTGPCAVAGGGWQLVSIPLSDFFDDNSFHFGGNGTLDLTAPANGGNGGLVSVVFAVIGNSGSDVNFRTDYWAFTTGPLDFGPPVDPDLVEAFEGAIAPGGPCPAGGLPIGFCTFSGPGSAVNIASSATPPAPVPASSGPNTVLQMDVDSTSFAGFIQGFSDDGVNWTPQDWSTREGVSFWMYGQNSGSQLFIDVLENRNPGSTTDDAERHTVAFVDDFSGWQRLEFPFSSFVRKEIGNGAPADGFDRFEIHGWALGTLNTGGPRSYFVDDLALYGEAELPPVSVQFSTLTTSITEGTTGNVSVKLNRALGPDDPAQVSIDFRTERSNAVEGEEFVPTGGTLVFTSGGPTEQAFSVQTLDDGKHEGDEQIIVRLVNPVDVERGSLFQASVLIEDDDPFDASLLDDFERGAHLWETAGAASLDAQRPGAAGVPAHADAEAYEEIGVASVPLAVDIEVRGTRCPNGSGRDSRNGVVPVHLLSTDQFDATTVDASSVRFGDAAETHGRGHVEDVDGDGRNDLVFHFRSNEIGVGCDEAIVPFTGRTTSGQAISGGGSDAALVHTFPLAQDWTGNESIDFWYHGSGGGQPITVTLQENRAPDPGPGGWTLAWADEFDGPAGTPPDPDNWGYEIGDVTPDGKNGWGNEELQYYTDDLDNVATDGAGNLVITLDRADPGLECYYGPCEFESARLISLDRAEFAYGRIESRLLVPSGGDGLWPAFWSLGTDITRNPWPAAGEIDFMEYVSRIPNEIFGTIHGPGYAGGASFGGTYDLGSVSSDFHTFTVEWEPNLITWYVDGIQYHQATPGDVAPNPWVFEKPFFLLLNFAIGGNFGGAVDPANVYPQQYKVDYVRVYGAPDTAERFESTFVDDVPGWRRVSIPFSAFGRSGEQPAGAPDDGLSLDEVWGYGLSFPDGTADGRAIFDRVELAAIPAPPEITVTTPDDVAVRNALASIADGGTITFGSGLAGQTIALGGDQLSIERSVTIDASAAPGLTISGEGSSRVFRIAAGAQVTIKGLTITDGNAGPQGGGILNLGSLTLENVVVTGNTESSAAPANFQFGGGGIYNGDGATLDLIDSTVANNTSVNQPGGGIYGFFNSVINVSNSTISGNLSGDVAGGFRTLGDATIVNSTVSGNTSTAWHGGGIFHTDGQLTVTNSTFAENVAPGGFASGILVATFGAPANATLTNNVIEGFGGAFACAIEGGGAATITSNGFNVISDGSCNPVGTDQSFTDALLGPLADNGGPTLTHALGDGSPAIDAADASACPATDQRGVARPQGPGCDVGAFERQP